MNHFGNRATRHEDTTRSSMHRYQLRIATVTAAVVLLIDSHAAAQQAPQIAGRWDATVIVNKLEIPFAFEVAGAGSSLKGSFFNGERRVTSTAARFDNGMFTIRFDQYATRLLVAYRDGQLTGEYQRARGAPYPFKAIRASASPRPVSGPPIAGTWIFATKSNKGETAFRFIATQTGGGNVSATILRVDG